MDIISLKKVIDNWLEEYFIGKGKYDKKLYESMYYSIKIGGKRIRPILCLFSYMLYKNDYKAILPIACSLEMIHTYSLIHDDLPAMDNDDLRRGKPTNHKVFGEAIAILAGDALLNEASNIMFNYCMNHGKESIKACNIISSSSGANGMVSGQIVDILSEGKKISSDELIFMHKNKTGALIKASILSGAILGGATDKDLHLLEIYGEKLGLAFQIKDDILDIEGSVDKLGKNVNKDMNLNKNNFITMYGIEKCKKECEDITKDCLDILKNINGNTSSLEKLTLFLLKRDH